MIRPATEPLREHYLETTVVVVGLAVAMVLPGTVLFSASASERLLDRWLADYRPAVYLSAQAGERRAAALAGTLEEWASVSEATVRSSQEAYRDAVSRLGDERVSRAGLRPEMFPYSIVVEPVDSAANAELVSRLKALETESTVAAVDVPSSSVRELLASAETVRFAGFALLAVLAAFGFGLLAVYLAALRRREREALELFERFGAPVSRLRRTTIVRGLVVGIWAGIAASGILLAIALYWRTMEASLLGGATAATPRSWLVVAAPLVLGPLGGAGIGAWSSRWTAEGAESSFPGLESLLFYD